jgi:hypothetical protein
MENNHSSDFNFGSKTTSIYTERQVKVFAIHEPELDTLSYFNAFSTACFSISTWCFTTAFEHCEAVKDIKNNMIYIVFGILSLLAGGISWYKKRGVTNKIKMESKNITKPPA